MPSDSWADSNGDSVWGTWRPSWERPPRPLFSQRLKAVVVMLRRLIQLHAAATRFALPVLLIYWLTIFIGTHTPHMHVPIPSVSDKVMHFGAFLGLAVLLCFSIRPRPYSLKRKLFWAGTGCAIYGLFDEVTQMLVKNRTADPWDYLADMCGMAVGLLVYLGLRQFMRLTSERYRVRLSQEQAA